MSTTSATFRISEQSPVAELRRPSAGRFVAYLAIVGLLLAASGGARWWQAREVQSRLDAAITSPFPLAGLPEQLGDWKGTAGTLSPEIAQAAGCSDHTFRLYVNERTGVKLEVIVLYGPASAVRIHAPELCYPTAGYTQAGEVMELDVPYVSPLKEGESKARLRSLVYAPADGLGSDLQEVVYSWRYDGRWTPYVGNQKQVERIPGMFKVQVSRPVLEREERDKTNDPCVDFLALLLPEIDRRLAEATGGSPAPPQRVASR